MKMIGILRKWKRRFPVAESGVGSSPLLIEVICVRMISICGLMKKLNIKGEMEWPRLRKKSRKLFIPMLFTV